MDDLDSPDHQEELSKDDQEVLRAFHDLEESTTSNDSFPQKTTPEISTTNLTNIDQYAAFLSEDEMLALFASEADEDITTMRLAVQHLEQANRLDSPGLKVLKRCTHKVAGTAAAIGCASMSTIAHHIEAIIKLVENGSLVFQTGLIALVHSVQALEATLHSIVSNGYESKNPLLELEEEYKRFNIDVHVVHNTKRSSLETTDATSTHWFSQRIGEHDQTSSSLRVDVQHFNKLLEHTEKLIELDTPMENAQKQVEMALNELHTAQARLRRLEPLLSSLSISMNNATDSMISDTVHPPSSLVARILQEARERTGYVQHTKSNDLLQPLLIQETAIWDEMEIDRFTEASVLAHSFSEAITDVATATSQLHQALAHLNAVTAHRVNQARIVRDDAFSLRSVPFNTLVARLKQVIELMAGAQEERVQFEFSSETIEIDVDILQMLATPFLELVSSSIAEGLFFA